MRIFLLYIRERRRDIIIFLLLCLIFTLSFLLYNLPLSAMIYPVILCFFAGTAVFFMGYIRVKRRYEILIRFKNVTDALTVDFPEADGIEKNEYQKIIRIIGNEYISLQNDAKRRYAEMMDYYTVWAHQIKTPIASMRLTLQNEDAHISRRLSSDLFRIEQYVEMVLTYLRLDSQSSDYVFKEYDLDNIVKSAVKKFSGEFIMRKLCLVYTPLSLSVITDEKWLSFVIEQVLSNALKYTRSGSISIFLSDDNILHIKDTGIGIAPEDLPRIFENGYTGYNGRLDKKASGVGLYLCKRICTNLGFKIMAESEIDNGTDIMINLKQNKLKVE